MAKKVYINEKQLLELKSLVTDETNKVSHKTLFVNDDNKPPFEKDEFTIGSEGGNNEFFHVNEENTFEKWYDGSILKDEDGKPLKMYHGTDKSFDSFSKDFIGSNGSYEGYGFNFTPYQGRALSYNSKNVIEAYLRVQNPMTSKDYKISVRDLMKIISELDKDKPFTDTIVAAYESPKYGENWDERYYRRALPIAARTIYQYNKESDYGDAGLYAEVCLNGQADVKQTIAVFEKLGYDSVIHYDNDGRIKTVIVFEPNQIKLTNNKTYSLDSNVMSENYERIDYDVLRNDVDYMYFMCHENAEEEDGYEPSDEEYFNPYYEIEAYDRQRNKLFDGEVEIDDLSRYFGDYVADCIINKKANFLSKNYYMLEDIMAVNNAKIDLDNVDAVNKQAKRLSIGEYADSMYLLTDGSTIGFYDHKYISEIDGMTISKFLDLGNIRLQKNSIELIKEPTYEQKRALEEYLSYMNTCYVDYATHNENGMYPEVVYSISFSSLDNPRYVVNRICSYFNEYEPKPLSENIETEVEANEVNLDSFKINDTLAPKIWNNYELNPRVRLKLLDIADDFWDFANVNWVKRSGIILTGSICNFNWSKFSDIDLHIVVDFSKVDERTEFVQEYFNAKKNEWNETHSKLKIYGYPVELYVEDINANTQSNGMYDLEDNSWIKKPTTDNLEQIGLEKYEVKDLASKLMTKIDDLYDEFEQTNDDAQLREIGRKANKLLRKIKRMRKFGLERKGETDVFNIVYKVLRRTDYMEKLWSLSSELYDKINTIGLDEQQLPQEIKHCIKTLFKNTLNEEVVADGNAEHNPFAKRWKYERDTLKNYLVNNGVLMTSKENGKTYKCIYDQSLSSQLGINYCICIQYNVQTMNPGSVIYIRALDKFSRRIFRPTFDTRGLDNTYGTNDDVVTY